MHNLSFINSKVYSLIRLKIAGVRKLIGLHETSGHDFMVHMIANCIFVLNVHLSGVRCRCDREYDLTRTYRRHCEWSSPRPTPRWSNRSSSWLSWRSPLLPLRPPVSPSTCSRSPAVSTSICRHCHPIRHYVTALVHRSDRTKSVISVA